VGTLALFIDGINRLNIIVLKANGSIYHNLWKNNDLYNFQTSSGLSINNLYNIKELPSQSVGVFYKIIEMLETRHENPHNDTELDELFPNDHNGFLGFDFSKTNISQSRRISTEDEYDKLTRVALINHDVSDIDEQQKILQILYPDYRFENQAIKDIFYWNTHNDHDLYEKLHEILTDIPEYPFVTGGRFKTEVLTGQSGIASKRLTQSDRVTYRYRSNEEIIVFRCKEHYEDI
jgi:Txe/YoeB family toxin of Txe-Axe toxin-antitoxin module